MSEPAQAQQNAQPNAQPNTPRQASRQIILDTNIVLDLFLFQDPRTDLLKEHLQSGQLVWRATAHMRNELERVLTYPHIAAKSAAYQKSPESILALFDQFATITPSPSAKAPYTCKDPDDQPFIDLAAALAALVTASVAASATTSVAVPAGSIFLISKDKAVLSMRKRLEKLQILVSSQFLSDKNVTAPACQALK